MNISPLHDKVIVKAITKDEITESGIILPDTVDKGKPEKGEVIAIGPGKMLQDGSRGQMSVSVGNIVLFRKYSPDEIKVDGDEYLVVSDSDILAILK